MGWNGSGGNSTPQKPKAAAKKPSPIRGLVAGAVLVAAVIGCYFAFFSGAEKPQKVVEQKKPSRIKEVKPAPAPKAKPVQEKKPSAVDLLRAKYPGEIPPGWNKPYHPGAYRKDGTLKRYSRYIRVITNEAVAASIEDRTFSNFAERDIASMLMVEPGETLVGDGQMYDDTFRENFIESLKTEIVIDKEKDTPMQQELKQAVAETRKELKARLDAGEDIVAIMNETRQQLRELGLYREEIKKMVDEMKAEHGDEFTEQDEVDLINAANQMLEERGCKHLELPAAFIEQVKMY